MIAKVAFFKPSNLESWRNFLKSLHVGDTYGILLFVAENSFFDFEGLRPLFKEFDIPIFGGIFPGVIFEKVHTKEGVVGCSFDQPIFLDVIEYLDGFSGFPFACNDSLLVLVDRRANNISAFLSRIFQTSSSQQGFIGGGAGSISNKHKQVLFYQEKWIGQGAILARLESPIGLGVSHGWQPIYGPLVVNQTQGNEIKEINWEKAFPYYQQIISEIEQVPLQNDCFSELAKGYPFGMVKMDGSIIVRDAFQPQGDGSIRLIGEIPQNSIIVLLKGTPGQLITAAGNAARQAFLKYSEYSGKKSGHTLLIDCISRAQFLKKDFDKELMEVRDHIPENIPLFGFLSLGEIASNGDRYLEFYNDTTVVGVL